MRLSKAGRHVRLTLLRRARTRRRPSTGTREVAREAVAVATRRADTLGHGAGRLIRDTVAGAVRAVNEIGGESTSLVRDAIVGVLEGANDVARITAPAVRNAVVGAVHGSLDSGADISTASRTAVEGAVRGGIEVGIGADAAVRAASRGAIEAVGEGSERLSIVAKATVEGVISGIGAVGGNVLEAAHDSARELVEATIDVGDDFAGVARSVIEAARDGSETGEETALAAATGAVEAAYMAGDEVGKAVRAVSIEVLRDYSSRFAGGIDEWFKQYTEDLSTELEKERGAWRARSMWHGGRALVDAGGLDLAASLAYFTLLSFFPLAAITVLILTVFADPQTVQAEITRFFLYFFPASEDFMAAAIPHLFEERIVTSLVALIGIVVGANGLFMAANRAVNRIHGTPPRRILEATGVEGGLAVVLVIVFLMSLALPVVFQILIRVSEALSVAGIPVSGVVIFVIGIASATLPILLTGIVFTFVYRLLPTADVTYKDSTFGALIAVILFEVTKYLFFWLGAIATQRSILYGPVSSVVILLVWSYVGGLIFLYGASVGRAAANLRPPLSGGSDIGP